MHLVDMTSKIDVVFLLYFDISLPINWLTMLLLLICRQTVFGQYYSILKMRYVLTVI